MRAVTGFTLVSAAATGLEDDTDDEDDADGPITSGRVTHAKHGLGVVTGFTFDGRLRVRFDSGETHGYSTEKVSSKLKRAPSDAPPPPLQSTVAAANGMSLGISIEELDDTVSHRQGEEEVGTKSRSLGLGSLRKMSPLISTALREGPTGRDRSVSASATTPAGSSSMWPSPSPSPREKATSLRSSGGRRSAGRSSRQQKYERAALKQASENSIRRKLQRISTGASRSLHLESSSPQGVDVLEPRLILYLNEKTFVGEAGEKLAKLVRASRSKGVEVLLVHENDRAEGRDGCEFGHLFTTTPQDLIDDGLYKSIAIAMYAMPHREVSLALVAQACGGLPRNTKHMTAAARKAIKQEQARHGQHLGESTAVGHGAKQSKAARVDLKEVQRAELERFRQEERLEDELRKKKAKVAEAAKAGNLEAVGKMHAAMAAAQVAGGWEAKMHARMAKGHKSAGKMHASSSRGSSGAGTSAAGAVAAGASSGKAPPQRQKTNRFYDLATAELQQNAGGSSRNTSAALERAASSVAMPRLLLAGMLYRQLGWRQALRWRRTRMCLFADRVEYLDVVDEGKGVAPTVIRRADIANVHFGANERELAFSFSGPGGPGVRLRALTLVDFNNWVNALQTPADQLPTAMAGVTSVSAAAMALMAARACGGAPSSADSARAWLRREEERDGTGVSVAENAAAREAAAAEAEAAAEAAAVKAEAEAAEAAEAALVASARPVKLKYTPLGFGFELGPDGQTVTSVKRDSQAARAGMSVGERVLFFNSESGHGHALGGDDARGGQHGLAAAMSGVHLGESVEFHVAETEASREAKAAATIQAAARGRKVRGVAPPKGPLVAAHRGSAKRAQPDAGEATSLTRV